MATLKISDLSVGDWVAYDSIRIEHGDLATAFVEEVRKPVCVQSILGKDKFVFARFGSIESYGTVYAKEECLHPILITPEILDANGWQRNEEDEYMEYYGAPTSGIAHTKGTYRYRLETPEVSVVCYFVHQLQNALRLAGVEKEIYL